MVKVNSRHLIKGKYTLGSELPRKQSKRKRCIHNIFYNHKREKKTLSVHEIKPTHRDKVTFGHYGNSREGTDSCYLGKPGNATKMREKKKQIARVDLGRLDKMGWARP